MFAVVESFTAISETRDLARAYPTGIYIVPTQVLITITSQHQHNHICENGHPFEHG